MNSSETAKKGFKTFILTLSISLIVFSLIYYFISVGSGKSSEVLVIDSKEAKKETQKSAFTDLAYSKVTAPAKKEVLAAAITAPPASTTPTTPTTTPITTAPTTTQSTLTVPSTGTTEVTLGLLFSMISFGIAAYWYTLNPRKLALSHFERSASK